MCSTSLFPKSGGSQTSTTSSLPTVRLQAFYSARHCNMITCIRLYYKKPIIITMIIDCLRHTISSELAALAKDNRGAHFITYAHTHVHTHAHAHTHTHTYTHTCARKHTHKT